MREATTASLESVEPDVSRDPKALARLDELAVEYGDHLELVDQLRARFEQDSEGHPLVRIVDRDSGETVALLTPEELRDMADATGLPPGLLVQLAS